MCFKNSTEDNFSLQISIMFKTSFIFLLSILLTGCIITSSGGGFDVIAQNDDYYNHPFIRKYKNKDTFMPPGDARVYITNFNGRTFNLPGSNINKKVSWSGFDMSLLRELSSDPLVAKIRFYNAVNPDNNKDVTPMTILAAIPFTNGKPDSTKTGYFKPRPLCPPPEEGCGL